MMRMNFGNGVTAVVKEGRLHHSVACYSRLLPLEDPEINYKQDRDEDEAGSEPQRKLLALVARRHAADNVAASTGHFVHVLDLGVRGLDLLAVAAELLRDLDA